MNIKCGTNVNFKMGENESEVTQSCPTLCDLMSSSLHQAPPSMGFSRQEYWSGLPFLQGIFPTQGSNPGLPHCRQTLYRLSHQGSLPYTTGNYTK